MEGPGIDLAEQEQVLDLAAESASVAVHALDHAALHALQENLSPGYLARIQSKAKKDWKQGYWWAPGEPVPDRAPDLGAVAP